MKYEQPKVNILAPLTNVTFEMRFLSKWSGAYLDDDDDDPIRFIKMKNPQKICLQ